LSGQDFIKQAFHRRPGAVVGLLYDNSGFWPGDVAAGVVGGAVGTAAAIATAPAAIAAPIGGDEYARRNGFVCIPGTWFRGEDGRRHICQ
jgi:hypothetical protein